MFGDIFGCHNWDVRVEVLLLSSNEEAKDATKHPISNRAAPITKGNQASNVNSVDVDNPSSVLCSLESCIRVKY